MDMAKIGIFKKLNGSAIKLLQNLGQSVELSKDAHDNATKFILQYVYNDSKSSTPAEARVKYWNCKKKKKSLLRAPPDADSLLWHITRANYLAFIKLNFHLKDHPSTIGRGWSTVNGKCCVLQYSKPALPTRIGVLPEESSDEDSYMEDEEDIGYQNHEGHEIDFHESDSEAEDCGDDSDG